MEQTDGPVETIILSSEHAIPRLTPHEADCVARIRARRKRIGVRRVQSDLPRAGSRIEGTAGATSEHRLRRWWVALVVALVLGALALL